MACSTVESVRSACASTQYGRVFRLSLFRGVLELWGPRVVGRGSVQAAHMRRLVWVFACCRGFDMGSSCAGTNNNCISVVPWFQTGKPQRTEDIQTGLLTNEHCNRSLYYVSSFFNLLTISRMKKHIVLQCKNNYIILFFGCPQYLSILW